MKRANKKFLTFISLFIAGSLFLSLHSQESGDALELQRSEDMNKQDKQVDEKIAEYNTLLKDFSGLAKSDVIITPAQTKFRRNNEYIELEAYTFIQDALGSTKVIGSKVTVMRLYFSGETLNKVETEIEIRDFESQMKTYHKITDPSPGTEDTNDIIVVEKINNLPQMEKTLAEYDMTVSNPNRLKFKREFYLPLLVDFERLFRYIENYQRMYGTNNDYETIEMLKNSQNY